MLVPWQVRFTIFDRKVKYYKDEQDCPDADKLLSGGENTATWNAREFL